VQITNPRLRASTRPTCSTSCRPGRSGSCATDTSTPSRLYNQRLQWTGFILLHEGGRRRAVGQKYLSPPRCKPSFPAGRCARFWALSSGARNQAPTPAVRLRPRHVYRGHCPQKILPARAILVVLAHKRASWTYRKGGTMEIRRSAQEPAPSLPPATADVKERNRSDSKLV